MYLRLVPCRYLYGKVLDMSSMLTWILYLRSIFVIVNSCLYLYLITNSTSVWSLECEQMNEKNEWINSKYVLNQRYIKCTESNNYCNGTVNCTVDHAQYANCVKKSISALSHTAVCRLQNKLQCLCNFCFTLTIYYLIWAHYEPI
jgi:hypothetical protein